MVYTQLYIVLGAEISFKDMKKFFGIKHHDEVYDIVLGSDMEIFKFKCCSKISKKKYIIGFKMHTYYRNFIKCEECDEYTVCDKCIGHTNNGYYDVVKILNELTEINSRHVCLRCYADNRIDLGARITTAKIIGNRFQDDNTNDDELKLNCKVCNSKPSGFRCPTDNLKFHEYKYRHVSKFLETNKITKDIKLYYMINDCLSCT